MDNIHILLVTRNRLSGLIDSLASIKRLAKHVQLQNSALDVTIQDNSDCRIPEFILRYFRKSLSIHYHKTSRVLPMSRNWNDGLMYVIERKPKYIVVLADRRLVTANLLSAVKYVEHHHLPFICFDHQDVWINATTLTKRRHTYGVLKILRSNLLAAIGSAQVNWHFPMLFNCVITYDFMIYLAQRFGSYADGSSPDMNFLARIADIGVETFYTYDAPCIVTNARHASCSNGSSALKSGTIHHTEHTRLSGVEAYPEYMNSFVTANITGSLARYWSHSELRNIIDVPKFFSSSILELSYPKSEAAFIDMKNALLEFATDFRLNSEARLIIDSVEHVPSSNQQYPIDSQESITNSPALNLLAEIENIV